MQTPLRHYFAINPPPRSCNGESWPTTELQPGTVARRHQSGVPDAELEVEPFQEIPYHN